MLGEDVFWVGLGFKVGIFLRFCLGFWLNWFIVLGGFLLEILLLGSLDIVLVLGFGEL